MKKVLALVLAVMMMSTFAFAAVPAKTTPGVTLEVDATEFKDGAATPTALAANDLKGKDYTVKSVTWSKGRSLVDSVKFDKANDYVTVALKENYTLDKETELTGIITLTSKIIVGDKKTVKADVTTSVVNNTPADLTFNDRNEEIALFDAAPNAIYKVAAKNFGYGTLVLSDNEFEFTTKVYDKDKFYLASNADVNKDVILANEDVDADYIDFINFPAKPTFKTAGTLKFFVDKDDHVYEVKDGKLVALNGKWDSNEGAYVVTGVKTLGSYVYSDAKLKAAAATTAPTEKNPDTGANDVVGIATALAAVALVSAAAISLKK